MTHHQINNSITELTLLIFFSGWRNLESSVKCVQALVNGCGDKFHLYVDQSLLDLIFTSLEHPNRFVRETAYQTCATIIEVCSGQEQINRRTGTNSKYFTRSTILIKKIQNESMTPLITKSCINSILFLIFKQPKKFQKKYYLSVLKG